MDLLPPLVAALPVHDLPALASGLQLDGLVLADGGSGEPDTDGLADWLRGFFGPLFLVIVSIVAIFFLFTKEITRFAQFLVLAIFIGIVFYVPNVIETLARAIARAMGVESA